MDFDNQIGTVGNTVMNVGRAIHRGWEAAAELELLGFVDALRGGSGEPGDLQLGLHANAMLLDAEFVAGPREGNVPQYAPGHVLRAGVTGRWGNRAKVSLQGTFVDSHYGDDANSANYVIPAYMVWDLTAEVKIYGEALSLMAGINNLLDEDYYSRIRNDGIDPAYGRNYYLGLSFAF